MIVNDTGAASFAPPRSRSQFAWIGSIFTCVVIACLFVGLSESNWHWFVIPTTIAAILIFRDGVEWIRCRYDVFDPAGLIGLYGLHYFLLTPCLHVAWDFWWSYRFAPLDWRPWLGRMALINMLGVVAYRIARQQAERHFKLPLTEWRLNERKFFRAMPILLGGTALFQIWVYSDFGGITSYIHTYEDGLGQWGNPFLGDGWRFTISESFPILSAFTYVILSRKFRALRESKVIFLFLVLQVFFELFFGGIRGSRNNVIFGLFWTVGLVHMYLRPITRKQILLGIVAMIAYMNVYYFYKHGGIEGLLSIASQTSRDAIVSRKQTGDETKFIVLHDFGRADIQALALYLLQTNEDYDYAFGRTYFGGLVSVVPVAIWPSRPPTVRQERTELLYGRRSPARNPDAQVAWIFGAPGESMLNFGPAGAPLPFIVWGIAVGIVAVVYRKLPRSDMRALLLPLLVGLSLVIFIGDSHVFVLIAVKEGLIPLTAIWLVSDRVPVTRHS